MEFICKCNNHYGAEVELFKSIKSFSIYIKENVYRLIHTLTHTHTHIYIYIYIKRKKIYIYKERKR